MRFAAKTMIARELIEWSSVLIRSSSTVAVTSASFSVTITPSIAIVTAGTFASEKIAAVAAVAVATAGNSETVAESASPALPSLSVLLTPSPSRMR